MLCSNCKKYQLLLLFEEYIVTKNPTEHKIFNEIFNSDFAIADENISCTECNSIIVKGESYTEKECVIFKKIFQYIAKQIMDEIDCCEQCGQGEDIQGLLPSIESCFDDEDDDPQAIFDSLNTASTISDILWDIFEDRWDSWEKYFNDIVEYVYCPHCGNGSGIDYENKMNYGTFDLSTEIYTKYDIDRFNHNFYGDELEEIKTEICALAEKFTFNELVNLKKMYMDNRAYIATEPVFCKLEKLIVNLYDKQKWYTLSKNRIIFRARTELTGKKLTKDELWEPPYGISSHGRYNDIGASVLYCANNKEVIKKEVPLPNNHKYNIAKFIILRDMRLFPINYIFGGEYDGLISENVPANHQSLQFKQQYIISNIVSAICLKNNYDGIVYRSTKDNISINYALFAKYQKGCDIDILSVDI